MFTGIISSSRLWQGLQRSSWLVTIRTVKQVFYYSISIMCMLFNFYITNSIHNVFLHVNPPVWLTPTFYCDNNWKPTVFYKLNDIPLTMYVYILGIVIKNQMAIVLCTYIWVHYSIPLIHMFAFVQLVVILFRPYMCISFTYLRTSEMYFCDVQLTKFFCQGFWIWNQLDCSSYWHIIVCLNVAMDTHVLTEHLDLRSTLRTRYEIDVYNFWVTVNIPVFCEHVCMSTFLIS